MVYANKIGKSNINISIIIALVFIDCFKRKSLHTKYLQKNLFYSILSNYDDIVKSLSDNRVYHGFQLTNKLKVVVISDPTTEKAAASMDVHIGKRFVINLLLLYNFFSIIV